MSLGLDFNSPEPPEDEDHDVVWIVALWLLVIFFAMGMG